MRWPLRYQILIPFTLVLLGTIAAVSALNAVLAAGRAHRQIEEQLQGVAATLADSTFPLTDLVLRQVHGLSGAEFLFTDLSGNVVASSSQLHLPFSEKPAVVDVVLAATGHNRAQAAAMLGIHRATLRKKLSGESGSAEA